MKWRKYMTSKVLDKHKVGKFVKVMEIKPKVNLYWKTKYNSGFPDTPNVHTIQIVVKNKNVIVVIVKEINH